MKQYHVAIVRGGPSTQYDISLKSGQSVKDTIGELCTIRDIVIDKKGDWYVHGIKKNPSEALRGIDVVFNAMHGEFGEDGRFQAMMDSFNIPYTGSCAYPASVAMNKQKTKEIYQQNGIKTPYYKVVVPDRPIPEIAMDIFRSFPMPVVLKPVGMGSSIGVSVARDFNTLLETLTSLFHQSEKVLVEEYIKGKEATVGVIDRFRNEKTYSMLPVEIVTPSHKEIFDYECKYGDSTQKNCPGTFHKDESTELQKLAKLAHEILGLRHYSRTDFIIHPKRGIFVLETNSSPGLTKDALFPQSLDQIGSSYREFIEHIIILAIKDRKRR